MRIAINALACSRERTGTGIMTEQVTRALLEIDGENEYLILLPEDAPEDLRFDAPNARILRAKTSLKRALSSVLYQEIWLPRRLRAEGVDLYYGTSFLLPMVRAAKAEVVCIHDFAFRLYPRTKSARLRAYLNARLPSALRRSRRIVCVSQQTADDLLRLYPETDPSRIRVVHNGVDLDRFRPNGVVPQRRGWFTTVGDDDPRKNLQGLLDAYPRYRAGGGRAKLRLIGPHRRDRAAVHGVESSGYISNDELVSLYQHSTAVVQPSLYEGFGLPVLEAMACGAPVACSDIPVFREVAGDCVCYFDPEDPASIADTMATLSRDATLREELSRRGRQRALQYPWAESARKLLEVFREAVS